MKWIVHDITTVSPCALGSQKLCYLLSGARVESLGQHHRDCISYFFIFFSLLLGGWDFMNNSTKGLGSYQSSACMQGHLFEKL